MTLRVPDTLTNDEAKKYVVSIRLWSDGLSFAGYIPSEKSGFFYGEIPFDQTKPSLSALQDIFFSNEFFTYDYKQIYVICTGRQYTLTPESIFVEKQKEQLMAFTFSSPEDKILHEPMKEFASEMLFGIDREVYEFCSRTLIHPHFIHSMSPLLTQWRKQNFACFPKQLYIALHEDTMDAACFDRGALLFVNSFQCTDHTDILYYILYIWKQMGLDQMKDQLFLSAPPLVYRNLYETLQKYVERIEPLKPQWLNAGEETPLDIIALFECEL
ncbi:MAG: DUF3822 family protein [Tannerella sp.]|jgi:hypothetical protein|nr:DUF3822 family protein [Tannerella sp.]